MGHFSLLSLGCLTIFLSLSSEVELPGEPKERRVLDPTHKPVELYVGAEGPGCAANWLPVSGHCYKIFSERKTWNDAERFCRKFSPGCHLASIHSNKESDELADYIMDYLTNPHNVWIGLQYNCENGVWEWSDKSRTNYLPWNKRPSHYTCANMVDYTEYRQWNDEDCSAWRPYLCECPY